MADVKFEDFSFSVKAALDDVAIAWLHTWGAEISSDAKDNCQLDDDAGIQLRKSYSYRVYEDQGEAHIGSPLESAYWEEYGTGSYAIHGDGRKGWWVYIKGQEPQGGGRTYASKEEAMETVAYLRSLGLDAYASNGRPPNYTLEKAFTKNKPKAIADMERQLKEKMGE